MTPPSSQDGAAKPIPKTSSGKGQSGIQGTKSSSGVIIPEETKRKYPDLTKLILESESMNTEERNYWLQVLPVMTPDQVAELTDILQTEKRKLAAIDAKYAPKKGAKNAPKQELTEEDIKQAEQRRKEAQMKRRAEEEQHREEEEKKAEGLLEELNNL